jgi:hypothetical protein
MKHALCTLLSTLALVTGLMALAPSAHADTSSCHVGDSLGYSTKDPDRRWLGSHSRRRPHTFMVGDSITYWNAHALTKRLPERWEISAIPGREVVNLPCYVRDRLLSRSRLDRLVIALGTNATESWTYEDYRAVVNMVPRRTKIVFVTPWRNPTMWGDDQPFKGRASAMTAYAGWMWTIHNWRSGTCMADWRGYAESHPAATVDGVHPYGRPTRLKWVRIIKHAAFSRKCSR